MSTGLILALPLLALLTGRAVGVAVLEVLRHRPAPRRARAGGREHTP